MGFCGSIITDSKCFCKKLTQSGDGSGYTVMKDGVAEIQHFQLSFQCCLPEGNQVFSLFLFVYGCVCSFFTPSGPWEPSGCKVTWYSFFTQLLQLLWFEWKIWQKCNILIHRHFHQSIKCTVYSTIFEFDQSIKEGQAQQLCHM